MKSYGRREPKPLTKEQGERGLALRPTISVVRKVLSQKNGPLVPIPRAEAAAYEAKGYGCWDSSRRPPRGRGHARLRPTFFIRRVRKDSPVERVLRAEGERLIAAGEARAVRRSDARKSK